MIRKNQNGNGNGEGVDLNHVLNELHAKKKWLDEIISGLEEALRSPDMQFVTTIAEAFEDVRASRPKVDLRSKQQRKLARLASRVIALRGLESERARGDTEAA